MIYKCPIHEKSNEACCEYAKEEVIEGVQDAVVTQEEEKALETDPDKGFVPEESKLVQEMDVDGKPVEQHEEVVVQEPVKAEEVIESIPEVVDGEITIEKTEELKPDTYHAKLSESEEKSEPVVIKKKVKKPKVKKAKVSH